MTNKNSRLTPIIIAVSVVAGILIGTFYTEHFSGNRLGIINSSSNKLNALLRIINDQYMDEVPMDSIVEEAMPLILEELDPHSKYIPAKDVAAVNSEFGFFGVERLYQFPVHIQGQERMLRGSHIVCEAPYIRLVVFHKFFSYLTIEIRHILKQCHNFFRFLGQGAKSFCESHEIHELHEISHVHHTAYGCLAAVNVGEVFFRHAFPVYMGQIRCFDDIPPFCDIIQKKFSGNRECLSTGFPGGDEFYTPDIEAAFRGSVFVQDTWANPCISWGTSRTCIKISGNPFWDLASERHQIVFFFC